MTSDGTGLSDNARTVLGIIFTALLTVNGGLAGLAAANQMTLSPGIFFGLGLAAMVVYAVKDQLGVRDATVSAVAKKSDESYPTFRTPES